MYRIIAFAVFWAAIGMLLMLFFWHQKDLKRPYVSLRPLYSVKRLLGYFYMMIVMFFSASNSLVTSYLTGIVKTDSVHANTLCLWLLPGFVVGGFKSRRGAPTRCSICPPSSAGWA